MVKDTSIKKKRKGTTNDQDSDVDIYKKVVDFEEKEATQRQSTSDAAIFNQLCETIRDNLSEINKLKKSGSKEDKATINTKFLDVCVRVAVIKKLNRIDKIQHVSVKDKLTAEKQKCDTIKLDYQNLVYELNHLLSEINKCLAFKSRDEEIELIDHEEFLKLAPEETLKKITELAKGTEDPKVLEHITRLTRLEFELEQRKTLAKLCKSLQEDKKKLGADIIERKSKLDALLPLLTTVLNATKPLQTHLDIPIDQTRAEHKLAHLLPDPLYIFYANCVSYNSVYDVNLNVIIDGDQEEAIKWKENQTTIQDEEDSEPEFDQQEEVVEVKKRRHRKSTLVQDPMEEKKKKLLEVFPLSVQVTMSIEDGPAITITVRFYTKLKIITATSNVKIPSDLTEATAREILTGENILSELVAGDFGTESPNPNTAYQLKKVGFKSFESLVPQVGFAYTWAQGVCGLNFLMKQRCSETVGRTNVEIVMKTLFKRLVARNELAKQLQKLEQNIIPKVPQNVEICCNAISNLVKWSSSDYQQFCQAEFTQLLVDDELIQACDMFYSATISRANATLKALIAVKNSYPTPPPIFALCLKYNDEVHHSLNSDEIRDIERSINTDWSKTTFANSASWLLSAQMTQLCAYLDVFMETLDPKAFPQNAMFLKSHCARNRRRPFRYRKVGTGIFAQY